jgi:alpha-tubulin suppressor-like RCC1 family protein
VYCWGDQTYGEIGNGISKPGTSALPSRVTGPLVDAAVFTQVAAGGTHACGLLASGAAFCWGRDSLFQIGGNGDNLAVNSSTPIPAGGGIAFKSIAAGHAHTCGLRTSGVVICWGDNGKGQLGRGLVGGAADDTLPVVGQTFTQISASGDGSCGLTGVGTIYCWGANEAGQTGRTASMVGVGTPSLVAGSGYTFVAVGGAHACALSGVGVSCWGSNLFGQLGRGAVSGGSPTPAPVSGARTYTALSSGTRTSCAIASDGGYCWGSSIYGATGGQIQALAVTAPQKIAAPQ